MPVSPYFASSLPECNFNPQGTCPSVEAICVEAKEVLDKKDLILLCYIFSQSYHSIWLRKIMDHEKKTVETAFAPMCLLKEIEQLPYMQAFLKRWEKSRADKQGDQTSQTVQDEQHWNDKSAKEYITESEESYKNEDLYRNESIDYSSEQDCLYLLSQMYYNEVSSLSSPFLKQYYRFDWEWKMVTTFINYKNNPKAVYDKRIPFYKEELVFFEWMKRHKQNDYGDLSLVWPYFEDFEKVNSEKELMKREQISDSIRWNYALEWGGDSMVDMQAVWAYFVRLCLQQRWTNLYAIDGKALLKDRVQTLKTIDWEANQEVGVKSK